ncbi:MAG: type II toxin-antitoxin system PemK/MazF family toxin [Verrucomicrobiota bacterium]|nr:type II toxin-antitoxin system PemK/MazF family toxin [Verrucomicrobiota bacterium]
MSKLTRTYDRYEVVKVPFPFADIKAVKIRPALILSSARHFNAKIGSSILAMITSVKPHQELWSSDIVIEDLSPTGLPVPSIVRFKLFTLDHRLILDRLGHLSLSDQEQVQRKLREILSL